MKLQTLIDFMETICPLELAEDWDNVGLLLGSRTVEIDKVLTCLTIDGAVVDEAVAEGFDCVVSHHPFPFHSAKRWTTDTPEGTLLLRLVGAGIAVYSPHTAHDSAFFGINRQLAEGLGLIDVRSLYDGPPEATRAMLAGLDASETQRLESELERGVLLGTGRLGRFPRPKTLADFAEQVKETLQIERLLVVGADERVVTTVAIGCGAADEFIAEASRQGADAILMGEARFHACEEARARGIGVVLAGHYATERFSAYVMAERIARKFPELTVEASKRESDPIRIV